MQVVQNISQTSYTEYGRHDEDLEVSPPLEYETSVICIG